MPKTSNRYKIQYQDLSGQVAIVTGAARGIGEAVACGFAQTGARTVLVDVSTKAVTLQNKLRDLGYECHAFIADVSNEFEVRAFVDQCIAEHGVIDILVNNAAISEPAQFVNLERDNWNKTLAVNLTGSFLTCREVARYMIRRKRGSIVNLSSVNAQFGAKLTAHYCASKAGIEGLSKAMARELGSYNIRVNVIAPGFIDTAMLELMPKPQKEKLVKRIPLRRLGRPADLVGTVLFLSSSASEYITGQVIGVNGGFFMC